MEVEIWKKLKGHGGKYEISSFGRLKSFARNKKHGRILSSLPDVCGYPRVTFYNIKKGTKKTVKIHKLVLDTFTNTYKKGLVANHFGIYYGTWRTRKEAIETHVKETGNGWDYCKSKGDSCVRAKIVLL